MVGIGAAVLFVRFYKLTSLSVWPNYDDGLWGFFALNFIHHWDWSPFYQDNTYPSLYGWGLGFLFKFFGTSLFTLWFYPAFLSALVVPISFLAARQFFSRSLSWVLTLLFAFSFWPMFVGRFGNQQILTLLAECFLLYLLGKFLNATPGKNRTQATLGLGLTVGLGFYIYISWIAVAFMTSLSVLWKTGTNTGKRDFKSLGLFVLSASLVLIPLFQDGFIARLIRQIHDIGAFSEGFHFGKQLYLALSLIASFFWGVPEGLYSYQPVWGGLLNPLLGSFFFIGILEVAKGWRLGLYQWIGAGLLFFLIPAALTHDLEPFRALPIIPLLITVSALGLARLMGEISWIKPSYFLLCAIFIIGALDFYHLTVKYHRIWNLEATWKGYAKPMERYRAYQILDKIYQEKGPGLIYSDFVPGLCDQTLSVADYAFNASENSDLAFGDARWVAVLANVNYKPFLNRRFPDGVAYSLSNGLTTTDGGEMLWVMSLSPDKLGSICQWQKASDSFCCFPGRYTQILRDNLNRAYPAFQGDPFLESCFFEKLADLDYKDSDFKNFQKPIEDLNQALQHGYPSAHLFQKLGFFYLLSSNPDLAKICFEKALKAPLDLTQSRQWIQSYPALQPPGGEVKLK